MRRPCCDKQDINKGAWSKQEDQKLIDYIQNHGEGCWRTLPKSAGLLRCGKSCRLRWTNYLRPDLKKGNFSEDEEDLIIKLHALLGNRWSLIAGRLPGRTDNEIKNYWNSHLRRKLQKMGVDPNNHRLSHTHPRPSHHQDPQIIISKSNETSSGAVKLIRSVNPTIKPNNWDQNSNDREVSDARSSLEACDHQSSALPDLNLDLSMTVACSTHDISNDNVALLEDKKICYIDSQNIEKDLPVLVGSSPTLHLFR